MPRRPATITQADVARAIRAAKQVAHPSPAPTLSQYAAANSAAICRCHKHLHEDGTPARSGYRGTYDGAKCLERIA
jgi:hypothetical protein